MTTTEQKLQKEIIVLSKENERLQRLIRKIYNDLDTLKASKTIEQYEKNKDRKESNVVAVGVTRLKVMDGGYRTNTICVIVRKYRNKPVVMTAIDEKGFKTILSSEEKITALCKSNQGKYTPEKRA